VAKSVGIRPGVTPDSAEFTQSVTAAIEALDKAALKAEATQDPIAGYLSTQSLFLVAMRELHDDSARLAAEARQPLDPATTRLLVDRIAKTGAATMAQEAGTMATAAIRRACATLAGYGAGILLLGIVIGGAGTIWVLGPKVPGNCDPMQIDQGGVYTSCRFWIKPPTGTQ
jgi:hypothetical protein